MYKLFVFSHVDMLFIVGVMNVVCFLTNCLLRECLVKAMVILNKISKAMQEGEYDANMPQEKVVMMMVMMIIMIRGRWRIIIMIMI